MCITELVDFRLPSCWPQNKEETMYKVVGRGEGGGDSRVDKEAGTWKRTGEATGSLDARAKHGTIRCQIFISKNKDFDQTFKNSTLVSKNVHFFITVTMYNIRQN